ncbi:MAG TPA: Rieske (2Fe-2S) protein, partial [Hyphomicrobiaceae bacterium]|nr:Rieske (2Fe-2S) protein [Hyphomicrobiaceae bacterium]
MLKATQAELTHRVIGFIDRNTTELAAAVHRVPVGTYADPGHLKREQQRLFRETPQLFCLSGELHKPGDWKAEDLSGVPILVVRGQDRSINAFLNVCRHRGARLVEGSGSGKRLFVCPYHAWSYK